MAPLSPHTLYIESLSGEESSSERFNKLEGQPCAIPWRRGGALKGICCNINIQPVPETSIGEIKPAIEIILIKKIYFVLYFATEWDEELVP